LQFLLRISGTLQVRGLKFLPQMHLDGMQLLPSIHFFGTMHRLTLKNKKLELSRNFN